MAREPKLNLSPYEYHRRRFDAVEQSHAYRGGDVQAWQRKLRRKLKQLVGYPPTPPGQRPPLMVRELWRRKTALGEIAKIAFPAEAGADIVAYVCTPAGASGKLPWFICLQGHSTGMHNSIGVAIDDESKSIKVEGDRDFALGCMKRGIAALCIEQRSFGYRAEQIIKQRWEHPCVDASMHALMLGTTLLAQRVYDVQRSLEYLRTRNDVDRKRIGVMGNSGGGTISLFSAALLSGITHVMPSCYFCTFRDSILSVRHCTDNYVPGLLPVAEMAEIGGLIAPRPLVVVAGKDDPIFPIAATRREFKRLKEIYRAAGAAEQCKLVVGSQGHRFYADQAWRAMNSYLR